MNVTSEVNGKPISGLNSAISDTTGDANNKVSTLNFNGDNGNINQISDFINAYSSATQNINIPSTYFAKYYLNGKPISDDQLNNITYGSGTLDVRFDRPLGYFSDDGQWVDLNSNMKLTDVFPDTHLAKGDDAAIKPGKYWFVDNSDNRKNYGDDKCKFDTMALSAFTPNSWGELNHKYYVNNPDSLSDDGPLKVLSSVKKADK